MRRLGLAILLACLAMPVLVRGDDIAADTQAEAWMSPKEHEAQGALDKDQMVTARRLADALLADDPDSIVGHYVLGRVLHESEGQLGAAIYHLGRARELFERRYPPPLAEDAPWKFHRELLLSIASLAGEIEDYEYELQMLDYHDQLYQPDRIGERAWPLMKLGRIDEARDAANRAKAMRDPGERSLGLNALCAIERGTDDRDAALAACKAAFDNAAASDALLPDLDPDHQSTLAVHAYNAALAARAAFQPAEAERFAVAGTKRLAFTPANPWRFLVGLYLDEGRGDEAAKALREMQRWRLRQPPQLRDQDRAEDDVAIAIALALAGRTEPALRLVDRAIEFPDRRGLASTSAWQERAAHLIVRRAIRRADDELLAEAASTGDDPRGGTFARAREAARRWADDEDLAGLLDDDDRLIETVMLFGERGATPLPPWLVGELVPVLGPGVVAAVLDRARARPHPPQLEPYWKALEAEVRLAEGKTGDARDLAKQALAGLPDTEVLLRARTIAVEAEAAHEDDDGAAELAALEHAYALDPSVIRRLGLSLPAVFHGSGPGAADVVAMLARSPRFREQAGGFQVDVTGLGGGAFQICLRSPEGNQLRCVPEDGAPQPPAKPGTPPPTAADAVEAFHHEAFAMPLGLTAVDMTSLDGSTTVAEQAVRAQVDQMLDELAK